MENGWIKKFHIKIMDEMASTWMKIFERKEPQKFQHKYMASLDWCKIWPLSLEKWKIKEK